MTENYWQLNESVNFYDYGQLLRFPFSNYLITNHGEILHLSVQHGNAIVSCQPPGGNNVMLGALKSLNAGAVKWSWDPCNSAIWSTSKAGLLLCLREGPHVNSLCPGSGWQWGRMCQCGNINFLTTHSGASFKFLYGWNRFFNQSQVAHKFGSGNWGGKQPQVCLNYEHELQLPNHFLDGTCKAPRLWILMNVAW